MIRVIVAVMPFVFLLPFLLFWARAGWLGVRSMRKALADGDRGQFFEETVMVAMVGVILAVLVGLGLAMSFEMLSRS